MEYYTYCPRREEQVKATLTKGGKFVCSGCGNKLPPESVSPKIYVITRKYELGIDISIWSEHPIDVDVVYKMINNLLRREKLAQHWTDYGLNVRD